MNRLAIQGAPLSIISDTQILRLTLINVAWPLHSSLTMNKRVLAPTA
jgi:hypothetical protein